MSVWSQLAYITPLLALTGLVFYHSRPNESRRSGSERVIGGENNNYIDADIDEALEQEGFTNEVEDQLEAEEEAEDDMEAGMDDHDPAVTHQPRSRRDPNRIVGPKKSKSLAHKDRVRAYNEFVRQRAEEERQMQREYEEQYADQIAEEKHARAMKEAEAESSIRSRQQQRREQEKAQRQREQVARDRLKTELETNGKVKLKNDTERQLAPTLGLLVENGDWLVDPTNEAMLHGIAQDISSKGRVSFEELYNAMRQ